MRAGHVRETPGIVHRHTTRGGLTAVACVSAGNSARGIAPIQPGDDEPAPTHIYHGGRLCRGGPSENRESAP